jgi:hypothetical protein
MQCHKLVERLSNINSKMLYASDAGYAAPWDRKEMPLVHQYGVLDTICSHGVL